MNGSVVTRLIPKALWGSDKNRDAILAIVPKAISLRRFETLSLQNLLAGVKMSEMTWLNGDPANKQHASTCETEKRREMMLEFLYWLFTGVIIPLVKTNFYATETAPFKNRILYFRHQDWNRICFPIYVSIKQNMLEFVDKTEFTQLLLRKTGSRALGFSRMRILPKETGARIIMNLGSKAKYADIEDLQLSNNQLRNLPGGWSGSMTSINQLLQNVLQVLSYEKNQQSALMSSSAFGLNDIYSKLKAFKMQLKASSEQNSLPPLYLCKVDIAACFDSINQETLLSLLDELVRSSEYTIQKYASVYYSMGKIRKVFSKHDEHEWFPEIAKDISAKMSNAIIIDQVVYSQESAKAIKDMLVSHIHNNFVKIGKNYYRQKCGIPQGSVLSTMLCSFFYAHFEKRYLAAVMQDPQAHSLLIRYVDDFLFVSTSVDTARRFCETMHQAFPDFGCKVNAAKTMTNFPCEFSGTTAGIDQSHDVFPWCGLLIDIKSLEITTLPYSRRGTRGVRIADTLTVDVSNHPGQQLCKKLLQYIKLGCHPIFFDQEINSQNSVQRNIYTNYFMTAIRFCSYLCEAYGKSINANVGFLVGKALVTAYQRLFYTYSSLDSSIILLLLIRF
eukprot:jgi/Hompol1/4654/HPOL_001517-RA